MKLKTLVMNLIELIAPLWGWIYDE